jgi:thiol-disulfide isomerase/thioredoxin
MSMAASHAEVVLKENSGQNTSFSQLKGKWVFINYWAEWCHNCLAEIPEFNRFYSSHQSDSVALFAVNYDALPVEEQNQLIKRYSIQYPSLAQDPSQELKLGDIPGVPITFVFNPEGKLVNKLYGPQTLKQLNAEIAKE